MDKILQRSVIKSVTNGFTLIELSIAMVIIGFIVGSVLVGQDLITASRIRASLSQLEQYNTAVNTFSAKYGYLPGDLPTATKYWPQDSTGCLVSGHVASKFDGVCNGDGSGRIGDKCVFHSYSQQCLEPLVFWQMLAFAKMIPEGYFWRTDWQPPFGYPFDGTAGNGQVPLFKLHPNVGVSINYYNADGYMPFSCCSAYMTNPDFNNRHTWVIGSPSPEEILSYNGMSAREAMMIDLKIDDGLATTGIARTNLDDHGNCTSSVTGKYVNSNAVQYSMGWGVEGCYMVILAPF